MTLTILSETRAKDRQKMALHLETFCDVNGISHERIFDNNEEILIKMLFPNDVRLSIGFNKNSSQPNTYVISWNIASDSDRKFNIQEFGNVNQFHYQKATDVAYGFHHLMTILNERLINIKNELAFQAAT